MNKNQSTAYALKSWLETNGPFAGTVNDMAAAIGVWPIDIHFALYWLRQADVQAAHGWTIPKQPKGNSYDKDWRVVDLSTGTVTADESASLGASEERVRAEQINILDRMLAEIDIWRAKTTAGSTARRELNRTYRAIDGVKAQLELI